MIGIDSVHLLILQSERQSDRNRDRIVWGRQNEENQLPEETQINFN